MENKICLDTDILVDFLRNKKETVDFIKYIEKNHRLATTHINLFELHYGACKSARKERSLKAIEDLTKRLEILNLSIQSVEKAGELSAKFEKEGTPLDFRDLLIGTVALINNYPIKTNNKRHFSRIDGLKIL